MTPRGQFSMARDTISTIAFSGLGKPLVGQGPLSDWLGHAASRRVVSLFQLKPAPLSEENDGLWQAA